MLILYSPIVILPYETYQVFISRGIPPRRDEQPDNFTGRSFSTDGHSRRVWSLPTTLQSFYPTGFI
ncbi:MAG: hypothetical protein IIA49_15580 [Bacteroidetes bacterium]|nr:hypothetical protein [Bacteroidota bacterium]